VKAPAARPAAPAAAAPETAPGGDLSPEPPVPEPAFDPAAPVAIPEDMVERVIQIFGGEVVR
jgi:hypothetical protein